MAPLRTYSRKSSTSNISAMTAFDILLAKTLTQRKLVKKKTQKKKYQVKELPKKIKSILCDESLHININDTFDKVLKAPLVNGNSKDSRGDTQGNSCKSWFEQTTLPGEAITNSLEIEGKNGNLKKSGTMSKNHSRRNSSMLLMSQVYKQSSKNSLQISVVDKNIPKIDHINCSFSLINVPNKSKLKKSLQDRIFVHSSTPITVKCNKHFEVQQLSPIGLVDEVKDPVSDCIIESLKEIESWNFSGNSSMPKCPKYAESFVIEASSILEEQNSSKESKALTRSQKLKQLMPDAEENHISDMQKRITPSSSSQTTCAPRSNLPGFSQNEVPHKLPIISNTQCNFEEFYNKCVTTEINSEPKIKVVTQEDFETFCKQHSDFNSKSLRINSQTNSINPAIASNLFSSDLILSRSLNDFEKFEEQFYQSYKGKLSTSKSITKSSFLANIQKFNFITHRKHQFSTMGNKSILLKPLTVILDDNIINLSNKLIKTPHVTKSSNGKQLTVCLTRLSLQKLKSRDLSPRDSIFGANRTIIKACRKFSSNSLTPSFTFQPSSRGAQGSSRQSEFLSIGRAGKQLSNITSQGEVALISSRDLMQSRKSINAEKENRISGFSSKQTKSSEKSPLNKSSTGAMQMIPAKMLRKPSFYLNKTRSRYEGFLSSDKKSTLQDLHKQRSQSSLRSKKESEFGPTPCSQTSKKEYVAKIMSLTPDRSRESWANSLTPSVRKRKDYIAQDLSRSFLVNPSPIVKSRTSTKSNRTSRIIESQSRFTQSSSARSSHITYVDFTVDLDTEEAVQTSTPRRSNEHQICTRSSSNISLKSQTEVHSYLSHSSLEKSHLSVDLEELAVSERPTGIISSLERATPRMSAVIVPSNDISRLRRKGKLQSYAESAYTVITKELESPVFENAPSAKEIVMNYCKQTEPIAFTTLFPNGSLSNCKKIGEGVYGEVFMYSNAKGRSTVMKIIPIEGDVKVNGEMQKKFHEILPEVTIVSRLSNLRTGKQNKTSAFCELQRICCVKGKYPDTLLRLWHAYDSAKGSENDSPDVFESDQLYIVLELADAGQDLEAFVFNNAQQALSIFKQVAYGLAIAEEELQFEHRDLHWGNILVKKVNRHSNISFKLKGKSQRVQTNGVEATIIDFTLSRMSPDMVTIFTDLGADPELFEAKGDYQFDIYRLMKERNNNDWEKFTPHSNILWLHYVLVKSITALRYKNTKTKVHKKYVDALIEYRDTILKFDSVSEFVDCL